jgi:hypothetical protein
VYFLLIYRRSKRLLDSVLTFEDNEVKLAAAKRLEAEKNQAVDDDTEVVLLQAASIEVLRETHGAYFLSAAEAADRLDSRLSEGA